jgi:hypothetical protein
MHIFHFNASSFVSHPHAGFITIAQCGAKVSMRETVSARNPAAATCDACWRELNARGGK